MKLRAWELEDWDALLMLDADTTVVSDIRSLFGLPTDVAIVLDEDKTARRWIPALNYRVFVEPLSSSGLKAG